MKGDILPIGRGQYFDFILTNITNERTLEKLLVLAKSQKRFNIKGPLRERLIKEAEKAFPSREILDNRITTISLIRCSKSDSPQRTIFTFRVTRKQMGRFYPQIK